MGNWIGAAAGLYLAVMSVIDIRKREIPSPPGLICIVWLIVWRIFEGGGWQEWLPGLGIGLALWCVSILSRGGIGKGDALVYAVLGLAMAALTGVILIVSRRVGRRYELPFLPFTALAYVMVACL